MALEAAIFKQDPFVYGYKDCYNYSLGDHYGFGLEQVKPKDATNLDTISGEQGYNWNSTAAHSNSISGTGSGESSEPAPAHRRKRQRARRMKNDEEMENQRKTHIAVERNRRRQMNDYLALLRSMMPPSYAQRGDQASIVGGAINYVKELEQLLQILEARKLANEQENTTYSSLFSKIFAFPQYTTRHGASTVAMDPAALAESRISGVADIEVALVEAHANIKILSKTRPKQLMRMIVGLQSICLNVLHLNITTVDQLVLYTFSVKAEDDCQLTSVNEIATAVHDIIRMIQEDPKF